MKDNMVMVTSASDSTLVVFLPHLNLNRTWVKRGVKYPIDRDLLEQAYYDPAVEYLIKEGLLVVEDKQFLYDVGIITEMEQESPIKTLDEKEIRSLIKYKPVSELEGSLKNLSRTQLEEIGEFAIEHYKEFSNDRLAILSKATGKDLLTAIKNYIAAEE